MANEIYSSSWWGEGVCTNTIDWGSSYKALANCTPTPPVFNNTYSLAFDGVDDFVSTNSKIIGSDITLSGWVNFNGSYSAFSAHFPMSITPSNTGAINETLGRFYKDGSTLQIAIQCNDNTGANFSTYYVDNTTLEGVGWQHICITYNVTTKHIYAYLNGVAQNWVKIFAASTPIPFLTAVSTRLYESDLTIGRYNSATSTGTFLGLVDEVSTYNKILTQSEITSISATPTDLTSLNPVAWYRNGDNGTWKSPQWLIPNNENKTKFSNYSFEYDGTDDYIDLGSINTLDNASTFTYSGWYKQTTLNQVAFMFGSQVDATNYIGFYTWSDGNLYIDMKQGSFHYGYFDYSLYVTAGQWFHFAIVFDGLGATTSDKIKCYINGALITLTLPYSFPTTTPTGTNITGIGKMDTFSQTWNGSADECSLFSTAKTQADITTIYNSGTPNDISSLSPVGYWRSEQSYFTDNWLVDNSALSNYSTRSFNFDGIDNNLYIGTALNLGTNSTISLWVKRGRASGTEVVLSENSYTSNYLFEIGPSQLWFRIDSVYLTFQSAAISAIINNNTTNWTNICFVRSGDSVELFLNGNSMQVKTGVGSVIDTRFDRIGAWYNATYAFQGNIDEVSAFNSALTSSDITSLYNGGEPARIEGAVAHWRMGEDATFNTNWNVPDNVGSNNGTSANMTISDLEGEASNYTGGGLSNNMTIEDRVGNAPNSLNNALSYNQVEADRESDVPT